MKALGIKQAEVADALGMEQPHVSRMLKERRKRFEPHEITKLAAVLRVSQNELISRLAGDVIHQQATEPGLMAFRAVELMAKEADLTADQRFRLVQALTEFFQANAPVAKPERQR